MRSTCSTILPIGRAQGLDSKCAGCTCQGALLDSASEHRLNRVVSCMTVVRVVAIVCLSLHHWCHRCKMAIMRDICMHDSAWSPEVWPLTLTDQPDTLSCHVLPSWHDVTVRPMSALGALTMRSIIQQNVSMALLTVLALRER
jgi:hypothetical protein